MKRAGLVALLLLAPRSSAAAPAVPVETACNGVDDDGDQLVDVLLPVAANACTTSARGACHQGYAACERGQRVCLAPPPTPEVADGIDNDCNGVVDDVAPLPAAIHDRALLLQPLYVQREAATDVASVASALSQAGVPFDRPSGEAAWTDALETLASSERYALAVVPGYLMGSAVNGEASEKLRRFVARGGVLVIAKPIGSSGATSAWELAGLRRSARHRDVETIRFDDELPGAFAAVDSPEERALPINRAHPAPTADRVEVYSLEPDPLAGTRVVARGTVGTLSFPVITRRPLGKGAVYALGHDLATFAAPRCYLDCFEPSGDLLRLFLLGAMREATHGHLATLATTPDGASSALLLLHDVDAVEATPNEEPAAVQLARMESQHHARATFAFGTGGVGAAGGAGGVNEPVPTAALCALGMCPLAAHGVTHPLGFKSLPKGTCQETAASYRADRPGDATLCGEVAVSAEQLTSLTGRRPRLWTSPYLAPHPDLFSVLAEKGFAFDAGFAVGDLPYNLPIERARILELPIAGEDALETTEGGKPHRLELDATNARRFSAMWDYLALRNADNESVSTVLTHVSHAGAHPGAVERASAAAKVGAIASTLDDLARGRYGRIHALPLETMGDFWRARLGSSLDASYDQANGYTGDLVLGAETVSGMTLQFGDVVTHFTCAACGPVRIEGQRVVMTNAPAPHARVHFVAAVR